MSSPYSPEAIHAAATREFQASRQFLWELCYRITGGSGEADDLVREAFVRAIERPPRDVRDGWGPWLARVAIGLSMDALRRRKRREYVGVWLPAPIDTADAACEPEHAVPPPTVDGPRYHPLESVSVAFLLALEQLTARQRAALILRDVFAYTVPATAKALDLTQTSVKATYQRARAAMQEYDASRLPPTRERQLRTATRLQELLQCVQTHNVTGVEGLLSPDAGALSDGGGEYHAARLPLVGRKDVARLLVGLAAQGGADLRFGFRMLNGLPAAVVDAPARPGFAPRFTLQISLDREERITAVHIVLASRKLLAVPKSA